VKPDRRDLVPNIIDKLDEPDPRAPVTKTVNGKTVTMVREIVRINHHRNCLMCHSPGQDVEGDADILTTPTPISGQPLPAPKDGGYESQGFRDFWSVLYLPLIGDGSEVVLLKTANLRRSENDGSRKHEQTDGRHRHIAERTAIR
jgi:hypothetical protein